MRKRARIAKNHSRNILIIRRENNLDTVALMIEGGFEDADFFDFEEVLAMVLWNEGRRRSCADIDMSPSLSSIVGEFEIEVVSLSLVDCEVVSDSSNAERGVD
jgi:hypothetical protein